MPVEAEMHGDLCEDEVFSQKTVGLRGLYVLLGGHRDQASFFVKTWNKTKVIMIGN